MRSGAFDYGRGLLPSEALIGDFQRWAAEPSTETVSVGTRLYLYERRPWQRRELMPSSRPVARARAVRPPQPSPDLVAGEAVADGEVFDVTTRVGRRAGKPGRRRGPHPSAAPWPPRARRRRTGPRPLW